MGLFGRLLKRETPPPARLPQGLSLEEIPSAWGDDHWVPNWPAVRTWLSQNKPAEQHKEAWRAITSSWLNDLADDLGPPYACYATENFRILCPVDEKKARTHQDFLELAHKRLIESFGLQSLPEAPGPVVVMILYDREEYLTYVSNFGDPPDHLDNACGAFLEGGYSHIAVYDPDRERTDITLTKDLMRNLLSHRPRPIWLREGLARLSPTELGMGLVFNQWKEIRLAEEGIRECWQKNDIQQFWSGSAFSSPEQIKKKRAHQLAEILTRTLFLDPKAKVNFGAFVAEANRDDGGESASSEHLGAGLGHWVGEFLGPGEWAPR